MTIKHHPSNPTLAAFAVGGLDAARRVVVATHLTTCPACRRAASSFEHVGGVMLDGGEPVPMDSGALQRALAAIASDTRPDVKSPAKESDLPSTLSPYAVGAWRWIGPGIYFRPVDVAPEKGARLFMLKAAPGTVLPQHKHTGAEWTCLLQGAFRHEGGFYRPGDFDEADEEIEHSPVVADGDECICLVALDGQIQFQSWIGRILQPFVRL
jgi:putative transcriptional regulator